MSVGMPIGKKKIRTDVLRKGLVGGMPLKVDREEAMGTRPKRKLILKDPSVPAWSTLKLRRFMRRMFPREWARFEVFQCVLNCFLLDESSD